MSRRKKRKSQNKMVEWLSPLHEWLYPPMTRKRRVQLRENLKQSRSTIMRFWRRIEDFCLAKPPNERVLAEGHVYIPHEEDYENDRRRLRLRLLYWACLFAPLIYLEWIVVSLILGGFTLMVEFFQYLFQWHKQSRQQRLTGPAVFVSMILLLILEAVYVAVCFGIFNWKDPGYWAVVAIPFVPIALYCLGVVWEIYLIKLLGRLYTAIKAKLTGRKDASVPAFVENWASPFIFIVVFIYLGVLLVILNVILRVLEMLGVF